MPLCWIQQKSPTNQLRMNQQGGTSHTSTIARLPSTAVTGSSLDSSIGIRLWQWQLERVKGPPAEWRKLGEWMGELQGHLQMDQEWQVNNNLFRQMLLTSGSLHHERKPSPSGRVMGWEAIFSLLSVSRSQGCKAQGSWSLFSQPPPLLCTLTPCASSCASSSSSSSLPPYCPLMCALPSCPYHSQNLSCQSQMTSCLYVSFSSFPKKKI